jgi:purine-binding chemotaxis protein CheW
MLQFLQFTTGDESYAVRIDAVREILEMTQITAVPLMPAFLCGVMNLRGAVVPVVDLAARLGFASTAVGRRSCIVVVNTGLPDGSQRTTGMLVDSVQEVFTSSDDELEAVPRLGTRIAEAFARSIVRLRGQAITELALDGLLEQQSLARLIASEIQS